MESNSKNFKKIENTAKSYCEKNNISHHDYITKFVNVLLKEYYEKREIYLFTKECYKLNNHFRSDYETAYKEFHNSQLDLFEWLDQINDFTFFILNPVYSFAPRKATDKKFKHKKIEWTGLQNTDILQDYINYKYS